MDEPLASSLEEVKPAPFAAWLELVKGVENRAYENEWNLPFFIGYACGASVLRTELQEIISALKAAQANEVSGSP